MLVRGDTFTGGVHPHPDAVELSDLLLDAHPRHQIRDPLVHWPLGIAPVNGVRCGGHRVDSLSAVAGAVVPRGRVRAGAVDRRCTSRVGSVMRCGTSLPPSKPSSISTARRPINWMD